MTTHPNLEVPSIVAATARDLAAAAPFYGGAPKSEDVPKIKAAILIHHGGLDKALSGAYPAQEAELKKNNIRYEGHIYPDSVHGFFNDATLAAEILTRAGKRVAILDIDVHHGNGTQDIFWDRGDVFYASVHADPATDYPFYWGHADEIGMNVVGVEDGERCLHGRLLRSTSRQNHRRANGARHRQELAT